MTLLQVRHETVYRYGRAVQFGEHRMLLRPRDSMEQTLESFGLSIRPRPSSLRWIHDVFGNGIAIAGFDQPAEELRIVATMVLDHTPELTPAFEIEARAKTYPFDYGDVDAVDLAPTLRRQFPEESEVDEWAKRFLDPRGVTQTGHLLATMTLGIKESFRYLRRYDPGTQRPSVTLSTRAGTCRDFALLMIEAARSLGLAARFVTGYLYSPARDGNHKGGGATHAWAQVYLPGAGWVEFDPTNGIIGTRDLIRVGVAREPRQAIPISGTFVGRKEDYIGMEVEVVVERVVSPQDGMA
ncbi:MAG: transglutaminase family protein [Candidatus Devosia phytovorans]|uniref:Transglutaminase family protein n=1 Tax=Candidatus Devosia phytovorans TaxID=3121372 RepID=A0AAJ5VVX2_9HYPH|nr:transglutaminase family protein [Devosia sp.]WEK04398.1 MAG: transglutaminase family protein [Devosia sp.]